MTLMLPIGCGVLFFDDAFNDAYQEVNFAKAKRVTELNKSQST